MVSHSEVLKEIGRLDYDDKIVNVELYIADNYLRFKEQDGLDGLDIIIQYKEMICFASNTQEGLIMIDFSHSSDKEEFKRVKFFTEEKSRSKRY